MAIVFAFPQARHRTLIRNLAEQVLELFDDEGEDFLIWHLGVHWDKLNELGIDFDQIETEILTIAAAVRAIVWQTRQAARAL